MSVGAAEKRIAAPNMVNQWFTGRRGTRGVILSF
jgi:hypothetical protein